MGRWTSAARSSVGKKILMAVTGLCLVGFVIAHLAGNFALLLGHADAFNKYSHFLTSLGGLLIAVEIGLVLFFVIHIISGVDVWLEKRRARPVEYEKVAAAGGPSRKTISSTTMIYTGVVLAVFTVLHVITFKYGPGIDEGYVVNLDGQQIRDLYRLVIEVFQKPGYVIWYVAAMTFLLFHMRHGFWSAFQSLGLTHPRYTSLIYTVGVIIAIVVGIGFLAIPVWIYITGGGI